MKAFCAFVVLFISLALIFVVKESEPVPQNLSIIQNEIVTPGGLLNSQGQLIDIGWARYPLKEYNIDQVQMPFFNKLFTLQFLIKKWDFFSIMTNKFIVLMAIADVGYMGSSFIHIYDLEANKKYFIDKDILPFNIPKFKPNSCNFTLDEEFKYETSDYFVSYIDDFENPSPNSKVLKRKLAFSGISDNIQIKGNFFLQKPKNYENIVMLNPLSDDSKRFFYNVKSYNMPVQGELEINGMKIIFTEDMANGGMDYGRGIWNYNTFWLWGTANGFLADGRRFALNLGGGFQSYNKSNATEDSAFIDGKIIKLNVVKYEFDEEEIEYQKKWIFSTENKTEFGSCYIEFERKFINIKKTDVYVLKSQLKQYFGFYTGWVIGLNNTKIQFKDLVGLAEAHRARW